MFDPLVGKTWKAMGVWGDGTRFEQKTTFRYELSGTLIISKSKGFTNREQTAYGNRNFGIRQYDTKNKKIRFWEYDIFGSLTTGEVIMQRNKIIYSYKYGNSNMADVWEFVDEKTYSFKVVNFDNGKIGEAYLSTEFSLVED